METEFLRWLRDRLPGHPQLLVGPGDDAALLRFAGDCAVTSDMLQDGVDFALDEIGPELAGRKSLAVNLSDLAAMAAEPVAAIVSLALPRGPAMRLAQGLYAGILPLAEEFGLAIAGGDTNTWHGPLVVSITALGQVPLAGALRRSGARPGDAVLVTGEFGGSILGRHLHFTPRVREARQLRDACAIHAATDVSDGLSRDLSHVAEESGCGVEVEIAAVPISADAHRLADSLRDGRSALDHALSDGEDFELILAVPPEQAELLIRSQPLGVRLTRIGRFIEQPGLWQQLPDGRREPLPAAGFEH